MIASSSYPALASGRACRGRLCHYGGSIVVRHAVRAYREQFSGAPHVEIDASPVVTQEVREVLEDVDRSRVADLESEAHARRTVVIGRFEIGSSARAGDEVEMRVDARRLHFFDLDSELALGTGSTGAEPVPAPAARLEG
jgi:hypothetical protein